MSLNIKKNPQKNHQKVGLMQLIREWIKLHAYIKIMLFTKFYLFLIWFFLILYVSKYP